MSCAKICMICSMGNARSRYCGVTRGLPRFRSGPTRSCHILPVKWREHQRIVNIICKLYVPMIIPSLQEAQSQPIRSFTEHPVSRLCFFFSTRRFLIWVNKHGNLRLRWGRSKNRWPTIRIRFRMFGWWKSGTHNSQEPMDHQWTKQAPSGKSSPSLPSTLTTSSPGRTRTHPHHNSPPLEGAACHVAFPQTQVKGRHQARCRARYLGHHNQLHHHPGVKDQTWSRHHRQWHRADNMIPQFLIIYICVCIWGTCYNMQSHWFYVSNLSKVPEGLVKGKQFAGHHHHQGYRCTQLPTLTSSSSSCDVGRALRMFARITSLSLIATFTGQAIQGGFVT